MNITAFVVGYNEASNLENCLASLNWCTKVIYYDMGSSDMSVQIAKKYASEVKIIDRYPFVEMVHEKYCNNLDCDLIVILDPDEVLSSDLVKQVQLALKEFNLNSHSELRANMYYYFKNKKLLGTYWGGIYSARFIYNKKFVKFTGLVHDGVSVVKKNPLQYNWDELSYIKHYWSNSWKHLFNKHKRYLNAEGESMHSRGLKYSKRKQLSETIHAFYFSFWAKKSKKEVFTALLLSIFWMWYTYKKWTYLKIYEKSIIKS